MKAITYVGFDSYGQILVISMILSLVTVHLYGVQRLLKPPTLHLSTHYCRMRETVPGSLGYLKLEPSGSGKCTQAPNTKA